MNFGIATFTVALVLSLFASSEASETTLPRHAILGAGAVDDSGAKINIIVAGSPAEHAGLEANDIVLSVGGEAVPTAAEFVERIRRHRGGDVVDLVVRRDGKRLSLPIALGSAPNEDDPVVDTLYGAISVDSTLRRTLLTIPNGAEGRRPAILLIGGIGCYTVDNARDPQDPYMRLTHDLARSGIVGMRLEKSGVGDSQGPPCLTVDLATEMHSYEIALAALKNDPHVDKDHVYLFGHSIGSLEAPRIAQKDGAAGVVIAEGVGRSWFEYELLNTRRQLELAGTSPADIDTAMAGKEFCMHALLVERRAESEIESVRPDCKTHNAYPAPAAYMQQAAAVNIAEPWTRLTIPVLAIYGSADFITDKTDHQRIVDLVNSAHPALATLRVIDGMDHHLDAAGSVKAAFAKPGRAGPYDENFSATVTEWLCAREHCLFAQPRTAQSR